MLPAADRAKNFLAYGIAASVALHLVLLPFVRGSPTLAQEPTPDPFIVGRRPTPPPRPTPTPTPAVRVSPPPHARTAAPQRVRLRVNSQTPSATRRGGTPEHPNAFATGSPGGTPGDAATSAPEAPPALAVTPSPSPRPTASPLACSRPEVAPATLRAAEPEMPALAQQQGITGTVEVVVMLDASSRVVAARVRSSPSSLLNAAAVAAARASQFRTEVRDCAPVAADYVFRVDFTGE